MSKKDSLNVHTHTVLHKYANEFKYLYAISLADKIQNTFYCYKCFLLFKNVTLEHKL